MNDRIPETTWDNPIWYRDKWRIYKSWSNFVNNEYVHDDYDGAEDSHDNRCGYGESVEACKAEIGERFYEWAPIPILSRRAWCKRSATSKGCANFRRMDRRSADCPYIS